MPYSDPEKQKEYLRTWIKRRREEFFEGKSCANCGSAESLELDHINPELKVDHRIWSWSRKRREEELAKCQILCGKCHLMKTRKQAREKVTHGSSVMYGKLGCRCGPCREWKSQDNRKTRERIKNRLSST